MRWEDGWPQVGDPAGDGRGRPVLEHPLPLVGPGDGQGEPVRSDRFASPGLAPRWHWQANPRDHWYHAPGDGTLHLRAGATARDDLRELGAVLCQQLPGRPSTWTTRATLEGAVPGTRTGVVLLGREYAWIGLLRTPVGVDVTLRRSGRGAVEETLGQAPAPGDTVELRLVVDALGTATFSWRPDDGEPWRDLGPAWAASEGHWIGAEVGLFASTPLGAPVGDSAAGTFGPVRVTIAEKDA
jgi:hypothetical protein